MRHSWKDSSAQCYCEQVIARDEVSPQVTCSDGQHPGHNGLCPIVLSCSRIPGLCHSSIPDVIELLIKHGTDINTPDSDGTLFQNVTELLFMLIEGTLQKLKEIIHSSSTMVFCTVIIIKLKISAQYLLFPVEYN